MGHEGMRSSLASRDAIADTVELTMRGHCYDALVGLAGCDKSLPGMMMAMVRLNVPSVFIYGGSILPGRLEWPRHHRAGRVRGRGSAPGRQPQRRGARGDRTRRLSECRGLWRSVHGEYDGLRVRGDRTRAAQLFRCARALRVPRPVWRGLGRGGDDAAGKRHPRPRRWSRANRLENAPRGRGLHRRVDPTRGFHLPAIAHEAGIEFDLFDVCDIFHDTPYFVDMKPGGQFVPRTSTRRAACRS